MARAKRTDRTDARRRYRAEQASLTAAATEADDEGTQPVQASSKGAKPTTPPQQRPSITGAFRGAMRPLDLRGDLRAAPRVLTHWGVLAAIGLSIASSVVFVLSTNELAQSVDWTAPLPLEGKQLNTVASVAILGVQMFVLAPPFLGAFLIGFTAKRASWLGGLVFGLVAAACFTAILQTPSGQLLLQGGAPATAVASAAAISPVGAALFASIAAWYRRFLNLANPNRAQKAQAKPQQGRGNMKPARR